MFLGSAVAGLLLRPDLLTERRRAEMSPARSVVDDIEHGGRLAAGRRHEKVVDAGMRRHDEVGRAACRRPRRVV